MLKGFSFLACFTGKFESIGVLSAQEKSWQPADRSARQDLHYDPVLS